MAGAMGSAPPPLGGRFGDLARDVVAFAGWRLAGVATLAVLAAAAEGVGLLLLVPLLQKLGIGSDAAASPLGSLPVGLEGGLALYVLLVGLAALVIAARNMAVSALRFAYADDLRLRLYRGLLGMEWSAFSRLRAADAVHVLSSDAPRTAHGVDFLLRLGGWTVEIAALLVVAVRLSPGLTATALLVAGVCVVLSRPLNRRTHALGHQVGEAMTRFHADVTDDLAGMRVIRSFGREADRSRRFDARVAALR
ncbi:MAG TPA: ABC transporter transmembrane domain-containing protein, partial [Azospirillum sp.]|nr:ABC transporter transmembrane domain-containing protein [Azospirillum sp.]